MNDDYLWNRSDPVDPEIRELEDVLSRWRYRPDGPLPRRRGRLWSVGGLLAAAVVILAVVLSSLGERPPGEAPRTGEALPVAWLTGGREPTRLAPGGWIETDEEERARVRIADLGHIDLGPRSRLGLLAGEGEEIRLSLGRGHLSARILAPPRLFVVETPAATAIDLGCAYELAVEEDGRGLLRVTAGSVELASPGGFDTRVPAGAACRIRPGAGPGLPWREGGPAEFEDLDPKDPAMVAAALAAAKNRTDSLTLWHLFSRVPGAGRERVLARLAEIGAVPEDLDREKALALDPEVLAGWREEIEWSW